MAGVKPNDAPSPSRTPCVPRKNQNCVANEVAAHPSDERMAPATNINRGPKRSERGPAMMPPMRKKKTVEVFSQVISGGERVE
jgi:hypothetical protein